jgi:hypothetical protein
MAQKEFRADSTPMRQADVLVDGGGSLYVFRILSESARDWVTENVSQEGYQPDFPNILYVEHRYARDLAAGMADAKLVVR